MAFALHIRLLPLFSVMLTHSSRINKFKLQVRDIRSDSILLLCHSQSKLH